MKPISVKILKAEKKGRKIILEIESDLYSNEVFAVTPFYDEGDAKNQLQAVHINIQITEENGELKTGINYGNMLSHFTKGHTQLHYPLDTFYLNKKDCALHYFNTEKQEQFTDERIIKILKLWEEDKSFHSKLVEIVEKRKKQFQIDKFNEAKKAHQLALENLNKCFDELL